MIFDLNVIDKDNNKKIWTYDTSVNLFHDDKGNCLNDIMFNRCGFFKERESKYHTKEHNPNKYSQKVDEIEINLGLNCNLNCEYCSQIPVRNRGYNAKPSDVPKFIETLKKLNIQTRAITFWGGEPLVYWKTIKLLVPELRKMYGKIIMGVVTNGTLLDKEKMDFFMEHRVIVEISDDGNNLYRDDDAQKEKNKLYSLMNEYAEKHPKLVRFNACVSKTNSDVVKIINILQNKVPNIKVIRTANIIRIINDYGSPEKNKMVVEMSEKDLITLHFSRFFEMLKMFNYNVGENNSITRQFFSPQRMETICGCRTTFGYKFTIDLQGNLYPCHCKTSEEYSYGNIIDYKNLEINGFTHVFDRKFCFRCPFVTSCRGNCPHATDEQHEISCPGRYASYFGYLRGIFVREFGVFIESIVPREKIEGFKIMELLNGNISNIVIG